MKGDVDFDLQLLESCGKCFGSGIDWANANAKDRSPCPRCFGTGKIPTYDGHEIIRLLEWLKAKKEYERGTD